MRQFEPGEVEEVVELAEGVAVRDAVGRRCQKDPAAGLLPAGSDDARQANGGLYVNSPQEV